MRYSLTEIACFDQLPNEILARIIFFLFEAHGCIASIPLGPKAISTPLLALRVVCSASCFYIPRVFQSDRGLTDRDVLARFDTSIIYHLASRLHAINPIPRSFHWHAKQCPSLFVRLTFEAVKISGCLRQNPFLIAIEKTSRLLLANVSHRGHQMGGSLEFWMYAACRTATYNLGLKVVHEAASSVFHYTPHELGSCSAALAVAAHVNDIDFLNRLVVQGANVHLEHPYSGMP